MSGSETKNITATASNGSDGGSTTTTNSQTSKPTTTTKSLTPTTTATATPTGQVQVTARFYDDNDSLLNSTDGYLVSLSGGETWRAAVPYLGTDGDKVAKHEFEGEYSETPPQWGPENIKLLNSKLSKDDMGNMVATGNAKNNRDEKVSYLQADVKFYADKQTVIGSEYTNVTNLPAGDKWRFKTSYVSSYQRESELVKNHTVHLTTSSF